MKIEHYKRKPKAKARQLLARNNKREIS